MYASTSRSTSQPAQANEPRSAAGSLATVHGASVAAPFERAERYGHRLSGLASPAAGAASASLPIQRLIGPTRFGAGMLLQGRVVANDAHLSTIHDALGRAHQERGEDESAQDFSDRRSRAIDDAQTAVHGHLTAMGDLQQGGAHRDYMMGLMDELQDFHRDHIDYVHQNNLNLFSAEDLTHNQRQDLNTSWDAVRAGNGAIRFAQGAEHEEDNRAHRANFARLMSRRHGRELVQELQTGGGFQVHLQPTDRLAPEVQDERERNRRDQRQASADYERAMAGDNEHEALAAHQRLMQFTDEFHPQYRDPTPDEPAAASKAAHGANLRVLRGLRDSENLNHSGVNTGLIAAPAHIVLGHELVHALHYKRHEDDPGDPAHYARGTGNEHWENAEEHRTISTGVGHGGVDPTENLLRAEHGLPARVGHTGKSKRELDQETRAARIRSGLAWGLGGLAAGAAAFAGYRFLRGRS